MGQARQTFERRQLGLTLRRLRDQAGEPQQVAAEAIGKSRTRIVQLEEGIGTASREMLEALLDCYGVTGEERTTVLELGAVARKRQKRRVYVDQLPDAYQRFADLEANASEINWYETGIIPGLLQSPSYLRAIFADGSGVWWDPSSAEVEDRINYRIERQNRVLGSSGERLLRFVITEDALRANMGSPEIMREQLRHILTLLDEHPDLTVRVLPNNVSGNPARGAGLLIFGFGGRGQPVAYSPSVIGPSPYYHEEADVTAVLRGFYRIWELAVARAESRLLIKSFIEEMPP